MTSVCAVLRRNVLAKYVQVFMINFIHHKSGSNEYKNKQTNITKLKLSIRVYQQKHNGQPCIRMCLQSELSTALYEAKNLVFNMLNRCADAFLYKMYLFH